jgi:hypothetical protein
MALSGVYGVMRQNYTRLNYGVQFYNQYSTAAHTLRVNQQIRERRKKALLGGGQTRIDAQHKKVLD